MSTPEVTPNPETVETAEVVTAPVETTETVETQPEVPAQKFRKEIQPVDDDGKAIGSAHVYEADTQEELIEKIAAGVANGTKKIHQLTRQAALETEQAPEGTIPEEEVPVWKPRELTADEKFAIQQDPSKAFHIQFEAEYGMTPEAKRKADQQLYDNTAVLRAQAETKMFTDEHPDYHVCDANRDAIVQYIQKHKLAWRKTNLDKAFKKLSEDGLLVARPTEAPVVPVVPARTEPEPTPRTSFPSTIRNGSSRATAPIPAKKGPSAEEIAKMSSEQIRKMYPELQQAR